MENCDEQVLKNLRKRIFITAYKNGTTHIASAYSCLEILYTLYIKGVLRMDKSNPDWEKRDRLILSKGHAALGLYVILEKAGLLRVNEVNTFLKPGTRLAGEPCKRDLELLEASTGSLGHGLSMGVGMALSQKMDGYDARTFVIIGDGESQEGVIWEAAMTAAGYSLDNLTAILDCNGLQKMASTEATMKHVAWKEKWESFGWSVKEADGHNIQELFDVLSEKNETKKPRIIIAHTIKGKGVSIMENDVNWHYKDPRKKEILTIMKELDIREEELQ